MSSLLFEVVSYIDSCIRYTTVFYRDFSTHWYTKLHPSIWQRFISRILSHHGQSHAPWGNTLVLNLKKVSRFTLRILYKSKYFSCFEHTFVNVFFAVFTQFHRKPCCHKQSCMWVKSVVLEYRRYHGLLRSYRWQPRHIDRCSTFCCLFDQSTYGV